MASCTRRNFIQRGMAGTVALGLSTERHASAAAASAYPVSASGGPQVLASHPAEVTITATPVQQNFCGVGFHTQMFLELSTPEFFDQVLAKRWRELNPAFARMFHEWKPGEPGVRDTKVLEAMARQLTYMKQSTGTEVYVTTSSLKPVKNDAERQAYARSVADELEYLIGQGATNLKYYCCTNELSCSRWADMADDLPKYQSYQQSIFTEIQRRGLAVKLLATDASPVQYWPSIEWAAQHMDDITGIYGGHHYINEHSPDNLDFYSWFQERCQWAANIARSKGKDFVLGEFGPAQYFDLKYGIRWDACKYFDTPLEPLAGLQLAEAALAAMNAGVYAMSYWTFTDYPDDKGEKYINQWGVFKWLTHGAGTRAPYYSYGLLTKLFHGPGIVYEATTTDRNLRVAALQHAEGKTWSIAILNRNQDEVKVKVTLAGAKESTDFRKYIYDPKHVPQTEDGDLQESAGKIPFRDGGLTDSVEGSSLAVYTTDYSDAPPSAVSGLEVTRVDGKSPDNPVRGTQLRWTANSADICYYRVFHHGARVGSTVSNQFLDTGPDNSKTDGYAVAAVDRSGNVSPIR